MISTKALLAVVAALCVNEALAVAIAVPSVDLGLAIRGEEASASGSTTTFDTSSSVGANSAVFGQIKIATSPDAACNYPNNGNHRQGSSCKFYEYSTSGKALSGSKSCSYHCIPAAAS
ncbi:hypothetical protein KCU67_g833, partial [Aureobasidium melanogenum]